MVENISNRTQTISTTSVEIAPDLTGGHRSFISITNVSGQPCYIAVGQEAVLNTGVLLNVGGTYQESQDAGYKPSTKQITAISSGAGCTLAIQERIFIKGY